MQTKAVSFALAFALLSAPAWAQNNAPASSSSGPEAKANAGQFLTQEKPNQWRASKLKGLDVYNNSNEKIGDIREVLLNRDGKAEAVVIGAGGFLGLGEHDVAVPFSEVKFVDQPRTTNSSDNRATGANTSGTASSNDGASRTATNNPSASGNTGSNTTGSASRSDANRGYPDHAMLNMSKDQLKSAPAFQYAR